MFLFHERRQRQSCMQPWFAGTQTFRCGIAFIVARLDADKIVVSATSSWLLDGERKSRRGLNRARGAGDWDGERSDRCAAAWSLNIAVAAAATRRQK